jgi:hypothetical protein
MLLSFIIKEGNHMTELVLIPRHTAAEVNSFTLPAECMTQEAALALVALADKKCAFFERMTGPRSKQAKAWSARSLAARARAHDLRHT